MSATNCSAAHWSMSSPGASQSCTSWSTTLGAAWASAFNEFPDTAYAAAEGVTLRMDCTEVQVRRPKANRPGLLSAVEEQLRFISPIQGYYRTALRDYVHLSQVCVAAMSDGVNRDRPLLVVNAIQHAVRCTRRRPQPLHGMPKRLTEPMRVLPQRAKDELQRCRSHRFGKHFVDRALGGPGPHNLVGVGHAGRLRRAAKPARTSSVLVRRAGSAGRARHRPELPRRDGRPFPHRRGNPLIPPRDPRAPRPGARRSSQGWSSNRR